MVQVVTARSAESELRCSPPRRIRSQSFVPRPSVAVVLVLTAAGRALTPNAGVADIAVAVGDTSGRAPTERVAHGALQAGDIGSQGKAKRQAGARHFIPERHRDSGDE